MASSSRKKTTMAKLNRETALRERRLRKQAKKAARKQESPGHAGESGAEDSTGGHDVTSGEHEQA